MVLLNILLQYNFDLVKHIACYKHRNAIGSCCPHTWMYTVYLRMTFIKINSIISQHHFLLLYYSVSYMSYRSEMNVVIYINLYFIMVTQHMVVVLHTDSLAVVTRTRFYCCLIYLVLFSSCVTFKSA